jgi:hypothetical protein
MRVVTRRMAGDLCLVSFIAMHYELDLLTYRACTFACVRVYAPAVGKVVVAHLYGVVFH